jgi:hypothetical protein
MKDIETTAQTSLEIYLDCPHCETYQDATEQLREYLEDDLRATDIDAEVICKYCVKLFYVTDIMY